LMAEDVDEVVGPGGQSHADRAAVRLGTEAGSVTLGGRRVGVDRPRVRAADGSWPARWPTFEWRGLMLDGLELKGRCCGVALGITTDGVKVPLGLWDGSTENKRVCVEPLSNLVDRGLDCDQGVLIVLDSGKALRAAVDAVFGPCPSNFASATRNATCSITCPTRPARRQAQAAHGLEAHRSRVATDRLEALAEAVTLQRLGVHQHSGRR
jgi:hypothetical protein